KRHRKCSPSPTTNVWLTWPPDASASSKRVRRTLRSFKDSRHRSKCSASMETWLTTLQLTAPPREHPTRWQTTGEWRSTTIRSLLFARPWTPTRNYLIQPQRFVWPNKVSMVTQVILPRPLLPPRQHQFPVRLRRMSRYKKWQKASGTSPDNLITVWSSSSAITSP